MLTKLRSYPYLSDEMSLALKTFVLLFLYGKHYASYHAEHVLLPASLYCQYGTSLDQESSSFGYAGS